MTTRRRFPDPGALRRARDLLLEAAVPVPLGEWAGLAAMCDTPWLPVAGRISPGVARVIRRRLHRLGSPPLTLAAARASVRPDDLGVVHVGGVCAPLLPTAEPALWRLRTVTDGEGTWLEEESSDFVLTDGDGERLVVIAAGGHLINGELLRAGDEVSVYGLLDDIPDTAGIARTAGGRAGLAPAIRSGSDLPLIVAARNPERVPNLPR